MTHVVGAVAIHPDSFAIGGIRAAGQTLARQFLGASAPVA